MRDKPIPYGRQNITDEDVAAVVETLRSDYLTQGPKIDEFERKFADYVGARHAVAVNNATSGLHIAAKALGVKQGQRGKSRRHLRRNGDSRFRRISP